MNIEERKHQTRHAMAQDIYKAAQAVLTAAKHAHYHEVCCDTLPRAIECEAIIEARQHARRLRAIAKAMENQ